ARCFEFLGGVPDVVIPDNLKSAVTKTCRYEPDLNPTYHQLAEYFNVAVIPARPYKPKDKSKAEVGVQIVERWIMARLRHQTFYSLAQLNGEITTLLQVMNNKMMKQYQQSRQQLFDTLDKPALHPLPIQPYQYTQIKTVRVHIDYHIEIEKHYYSVPHQWVKKRLRAHVSAQLVQLYHDDTLIAQHPRSHQIGGHTTQAHHMPKAHQKQHDQSPINLRSWALNIGEYTHQVIELQLGRRRHPEQAYRVCLGILSLAKTYSKPRLEQACYRAIAMNATALKSIKQMLKKGLDKQPLPTKQTEPEKAIKHDNIRGTDYYH
ncbi:MAG: IS21 family transposase, partial [Glaciecola sp.]